MSDQEDDAAAYPGLDFTTEERVQEALDAIVPMDPLIEEYDRRQMELARGPECGHQMHVGAVRNAADNSWMIRVEICNHMTAAEVIRACTLIGDSLADTQREAIARLAGTN